MTSIWAPEFTVPYEALENRSDVEFSVSQHQAAVRIIDRVSPEFLQVLPARLAPHVPQHLAERMREIEDHGGRVSVYADMDIRSRVYRFVLSCRIYPSVATIDLRPATKAPVQEAKEQGPLHEGLFSAV